MTCVLRVTAPGIAAAVEGISLKPYRLEGDTAHFGVSEAAFADLSSSIGDAIAFLRREKASVESLMALPSASGWLDFGVENLDMPAQFPRISPELVCLAGKAGLGLELSLFVIGEPPVPSA